MHAIKHTEKGIEAAVSGRLDRNDAQVFTVEMETAISEWGGEGRSLVVDLSNVEYLSSAGLGALARLFRTAKTVGMGMSIRCRRPEILSLIQLAGLDRLIDIIES